MLARLSLFTTLLLALPVLAEEDCDCDETTATEEVVVPSPYSGSAELGTIRTTGNTDTSSINGAFDIKRTGELWDVQLKLTAATSKEDGETSKEKYNGSLQFDRNFNERSYLAMVAEQERDRFSGFEYQTTASIGYGYRFIKREDMTLDTEVGPGFRRDKEQESGNIEEETIGRLDFNYAWTINDGVIFTQDINAELGNENSTYRSETALQSKVIGALSTKISYKIKYVDQVPEGNENTDRELGITFLYSF